MMTEARLPKTVVNMAKVVFAKDPKDNWLSHHQFYPHYSLIELKLIFRLCSSCSSTKQFLPARQQRSCRSLIKRIKPKTINNIFTEKLQNDSSFIVGMSMHFQPSKHWKKFSISTIVPLKETVGFEPLSKWLFWILLESTQLIDLFEAFLWYPNGTLPCTQQYTHVPNLSKKTLFWGTVVSSKFIALFFLFMCLWNIPQIKSVSSIPEKASEFLTNFPRFQSW